MDTRVKHGAGVSVGRMEDQALLRGTARFVDDVPVTAPLHACFVRSPHAHARILSIDTSMAADLPGVVGIYSAADLRGDVTTLRMPLGFPSPTMPKNTTPFVLAPDEVSFVGEALAVVVAESRYLAEDAAQMVMVDYDILPAVSDCRAAVEPGSPTVRTEIESNVLQQYQLAYGDCDSVFNAGHTIVADDFWVHRGCAHSMEGRGVLAVPDLSSDTLMVWSSTQLAHELHAAIAQMLGQPEDKLRVITPDVGGGFGAKFMIYPEEVAIPAVARKLRRPVKWVEDRREHFTSAIQERDQYWHAEMAVDAAGKIVGLRGSMIHDHGAYTPQGTNVAYNAASSLTGPYVVPNFLLDVQVAHTNKVPVATIRGAGYPQANFVMERLLDQAALVLGLDRADLRQRNLIPPEKIPYTKPLKSRAGLPLVVDSGNFPALQAALLERIDYAGFQARQDAARARGVYLGIGIANSVKPTGRGPFETAKVRVLPSGKITVYTGALAMGQGLKTTLAQICAGHFGVSIDAIDVIAGDTSFVGYGMGGFASRQTIMAGSAVHQASIDVVAKARAVAAAMLKQPESEMSVQDGYVTGAEGKSLSLAQIALAMKGAPGYSLPYASDPGLEATSHFHCDDQTYAGASHGCEVEVDPMTGAITLTRYVAVQDSGNLINPQVAEGQVHGGVVHGIGNALFEFMAYDESAQPVSTTFAEYLLPTAPELPHIDVLFCNFPSPLNPLGVKGIGETATIPVASAIIGAVEHALSDIGVRIAESPLGPVRLLELIDATGHDAHLR